MKVAIVIPVYTEDLNEFEVKSLEQCYKILSKYDTYLVAPEKIETEKFSKTYPGINIKKWNNSHFADIKSYNQLLLSSIFYEEFMAYDYILIYQLDAWVFEDKLTYWCSKNYDYIGAPDSDNREEIGLINKLFSRVLLNGGFSLRKVDKSIEICKWYNRFWAKGYNGHEDSVFSAHYARFFILGFFLKLPGYKEALQFAFEKSPEKEFEQNGRQLPFGCHAFRRYEPEFWEKHGIK